MTGRILAIEMRRSSARWTAAAFVALIAVLLYLTYSEWGSRLMVLALWQREFLYLLWPLALAAGAWQALRDRRSRVGELFSTTVRPRWQRVAPTAAAMAIGVGGAYLVTFVAGATRALPGGYFPVAVLPMMAVGALSLVAAAWLGMAIGRALPSAVIPPLLVIGGYLILLVFAVVGHRDGRTNDVALLSPAAVPIRTFGRDFVTYPMRVSLGQAAWLAGLAGTGLVLTTATRWRVGTTGVALGLLGLVAAFPLLPPGTADGAVTDPHAIALVCTKDTPRVCVTATHASALKHLRGPARHALSLLAAKLPQAPTMVVESHTTWTDETPAPQPADTLFVELRIQPDGKPRGAMLELRWELLYGAGTRRCANVVNNDHGYARLAVAAWLLDEQPPTESEHPMRKPVEKILAQLRRLPFAEQRARVAEFRRAALACEETDLADLLTRS